MLWMRLNFGVDFAGRVLQVQQRRYQVTNQAVFAGFYEQTQQPNRAITLNTNGIILEGLLYSKVGRPLEVWAHEKH